MCCGKDPGTGRPMEAAAAAAAAVTGGAVRGERAPHGLGPGGCMRGSCGKAGHAAAECAGRGLPAMRWAQEVGRHCVPGGRPLMDGLHAEGRAMGGCALNAMGSMQMD